MSATSGIPIHDDLKHAFATAQRDPSIRFLKLAIRDEHIVLDSSVPAQGDLSSDLAQLQDMLQDDVAAYILARLDDASSQWLAISYVPDTAKVREKMLYAATRNNLTKGLGSGSFPETLFATSKADLTSEAYAAHQRHLAAPIPLSTREKEMVEIRAAANASSSQGSSVRRNHLAGAGVEVNWPDDVTEAVQKLSADDIPETLVVLNIDTTNETLQLASDVQCGVNELAASIPSDSPAYALFSWSHDNQRDIVFIYSCPSSSPIRNRMIYSSSLASVVVGVKALGLSITKKVETSNPKEVDERFLRVELGLDEAGEVVPVEEKKAFAKPRGPARRQR
ncbi:hypothetical protein M422DRAFT_786342 [Sphaerobolus stellatus SS14]|uniref:Twinfilin n=1 Tax=Sphaerobolus stellatus (strain SS14) TaxID=990650 RepID=A0A0C9UCJ6_SPHS4|nr:hypothetical protein M422DRAFT_786342 [Sphaerobolus stellatus SS14]